MNTRTRRTAGASNPFAVPPQFSHASVSAWAEALPLANQEFSIRALLAIIRELNRKEQIPCGDRLAVLERLRPTVEMLSQQCVDTQLSDEAFPLPQRMQRVANRCFLLALEMAHGYRRIALHRDFSSEAVMDDRGRTTVIYRSLQAYGQALLRAAECYQPAPQKFWHSVYELYRIAEAHDLLSTCPPSSTPGEIEGTIRDRFATIALFSVAATNRHRPREIRQIYALIGRISGAAEIRQALASKDHYALFTIDLASDRGPFRASAPEREVGDDFRFLLVRGFIDHLLAPVSTGGGGQGRGRELSVGTIKRLARSFGAPERRRSQRLVDRGQHVVIVGLKQMIEALWRGRPAATLPAEDSAVQYKGVKWLSVPDFKVEDVLSDRIGAVGRGGRSETTVGAMLAGRKELLSRDDIWGDRQVGGPGEVPEPSTNRAATINSSARGYCLVWTRETAACLRVGELVGFPTEHGVLHVGVVRWLNQVIDGDLMLGVELLAPRAYAVRLAGSGRGVAMETALFVPADKRLSQAAGILVQPSRFDVGQALMVEDAGVRANYRIERLLEASPSFAHFALATNDALPVMLD